MPEQEKKQNPLDGLACSIMQKDVQITSTDTNDEVPRKEQYRVKPDFPHAPFQLLVCIPASPLLHGRSVLMRLFIDNQPRAQWHFSNLDRLKEKYRCTLSDYPALDRDSEQFDDDPKPFYFGRFNVKVTFCLTSRPVDQLTDRGKRWKQSVVWWYGPGPYADESEDEEKKKEEEEKEPLTLVEQSERNVAKIKSDLERRNRLGNPARLRGRRDKRPQKCEGGYYYIHTSDEEEIHGPALWAMENAASISAAANALVPRRKKKELPPWKKNKNPVRRSPLALEGSDSSTRSASNSNTSATTATTAATTAGSTSPSHAAAAPAPAPGTAFAPAFARAAKRRRDQAFVNKERNEYGRQSGIGYGLDNAGHDDPGDEDYTPRFAKRLRYGITHGDEDDEPDEDELEDMMTIHATSAPRAPAPVSSLGPVSAAAPARTTAPAPAFARRRQPMQQFQYVSAERMAAIKRMGAKAPPRPVARNARGLTAPKPPVSAKGQLISWASKNVGADQKEIEERRRKQKEDEDRARSERYRVEREEYERGREASLKRKREEEDLGAQRAAQRLKMENTGLVKPVNPSTSISSMFGLQGYGQAGKGSRGNEKGSSSKVVAAMAPINRSMASSKASTTASAPALKPVTATAPVPKLKPITKPIPTSTPISAPAQDLKKPNTAPRNKPHIQLHEYVKSCHANPSASELIALDNTLRELAKTKLTDLNERVQATTLTSLSMLYLVPGLAGGVRRKEEVMRVVRAWRVKWPTWDKAKPSLLKFLDKNEQKGAYWFETVKRFLAEHK